MSDNHDWGELNGWQNIPSDDNFEIFERWMTEHYEQVCTEAIVHQDADSLEFLSKLDMYFASIDFFNKNKMPERSLKEVAEVVKLLKPWLE